MTDAAALLIRRRRPIGEPDDLEPSSTPGFSLLRGSAGAGRPLLSLAALGMPFDDVTQLVFDATVDVAAIDGLSLDRSFETVIVASHLVNSPDEEVRRAWLRAAARHLGGNGDV